jgi:hypothetical protein
MKPNKDPNSPEIQSLKIWMLALPRMRITRLGMTGLAIALVGCATSNLPEGLPRGARLVGGGLQIAYRAPTAGTAILMEQTSRRIVATQSLDQGDAFDFNPSSEGNRKDREIILSMFAATNAVQSGEVIQVPTNTFFQLYFVPVKAKKE